MKITVFLSALFCSALAAPNILEGGLHPHADPFGAAPAYSAGAAEVGVPAVAAPASYAYTAPAVGLVEGVAATHSAGAAAEDVAAVAAPASYAYPAPAVGLVEGVAATHSAGAAAEGVAATAGGAASGPVVGILRDDRVVDESGSYSFDVAGEDGTARQESGVLLPEGGLSQTGSYTYTQDDGTVFELKYVADTSGFQPESAALPALPQFVLDQIEFAKNNPESESLDGAYAGEGEAEGAYTGEGAGVAVAGAATVGAVGGAAPIPAAPIPAAPGSSYLPPGRR